jgi:hypothetical protein
MYRFSTWVRRKVIGNGSFYLGLYGYNSAGSNEGVLTRSGGSNSTNPYFTSTGWWGSANTWYLVVGHVWPAGSGTGSAHPDSGIYDLAGNRVGSTGDFVWRDTTVNSLHRTYLYYSTDTSTNQQWYQPRVDLKDGSEPSISELLNNAGNKLIDTTGNGNDFTMYGVNWFADESNGIIQTNGSSTSYLESATPNLTSTNYTVIGAARYSGSVRGRMINGKANNWLLGHWSNSVGNYYANGWVSVVGTGGSDTLWRVYAATGNITAAQYSLYINGILTSGPNTGGTQGPNGITIGRIGYATSEESTGRFGFLHVYNRVMTADEIQQNFNALRGRFGI